MRLQSLLVSDPVRLPRPFPSAPDAVIGRLKQALPDIENRAAALDIQGRFPVEDVQLLRNIGVTSLFAGAEFGGMAFADRHAFVDALFKCLRLIGAANLSLARIFEGHVNAIVLIERYGDGACHDRLGADLAAGKTFGVWNTEPSPGVALTPEAGGWRLSGAKTYATGAGQIDRAIVTARLPDGGKQMLLPPVGDMPERADPMAWQTSGMRATVSGRYDFSDMNMSSEMFVGHPGDYEREPMFTAGAWRFAAAQLGAVEALVAEFRTHLRMNGGDADPIQRARFGHAVSKARTAFLWVREAAFRAEIDPMPEAAAFVLMTRGIVEDAGLAIIEAVQRGVGTRAFFSSGKIERVMRDLQLYLRQAAPDQALDRAASHWLEADCWGDDPWW